MRRRHSLLRPRRSHAEAGDQQPFDAEPETADEQRARIHDEWLAQRIATKRAPAPPAEPTDEELRAMLDAARERQGLAAPTPAQDARHAEWAEQQRRLQGETLGDVLARTPCPPGAPVERRPDFQVSETAEARIGRLAVERAWAAIPAAASVCSAGCAKMPPRPEAPDQCGGCGAVLVPVTWDRLGALLGPVREGTRGRRFSALGGVKTHDGRVLTGAAAVREIRSRIGTAATTILLGATRAGKSIAAAAFADERLSAGVEGLRWVNAVTLGEVGAIDRAKAARFLVLDDVGEEFAMAPAGSWLFAQKAAPICTLVGALARARGQRLLVTTWMDTAAMDRHYGGGVATRFCEGAETVEIVRPGT